MKEEIYHIKAEIFNALAHPLRLKILEKLRDGACCVCNMIPYLDAEQSNVSHHLAILKNAGIVRCEKKRLEVWYEIADKRIFDIIKTIEECLKDDFKKKSALLKTMAKR